MLYKLGLIDPPWEYTDKKNNDPAMGGITYPILSAQELASLSLYKAFEKDSVLGIWATMPKLIDDTALTVIKAWGFKPITVLFTWVKLNKNGIGYYSGLGHHTNSNIEVMILAKKGKGLPRLDKSVKQLIFAPIGKHSEKPQEQYMRLLRLYGNVPRIELFARKQNPPPEGWQATGLDYDGIDIKEWIKQYNGE